MIAYGNVCLRQFPKTERYVMAARIRGDMYDLLELIVAANKHYYKKTTLQEIDTKLEALRSLLRVAVREDMKYLPPDKWANWAEMLNEIGRMLGGWFKSLTQ
ncbi:hypothetical protein SDC9_189493 [bioreactor metagenome]|uniref:bAvd-like domain-containing protein n=1 Tax=bioreactor metagenome TaxID=1076179 RepID=A0A645HSB4_9ZZZZ